jgi:hypothetical protein
MNLLLLLLSLIIRITGLGHWRVTMVTFKECK